MKTTMMKFVAMVIAALVFCMNTTTAMAAPATQPNTGTAATSITKVSLEASKDAKVVADGTSNVDSTTPASLVTAADSENYTVSFAWAAIEANKTVGGDVYPEAIATKDNPAYIFSTDYSYYVVATFTAKEGKDFNGEVQLDVNVEGCVAKKDATQMLVYVPIAFGTYEGEAQEEQKEETPQTSAGIHIEINNNGNNNNNNNAIVIGNGNTVSITNGNDATSNSNSATGSKNLKIRGKVVKSSNGKAVVKIRWNKISGASSYYLSDESGDIEEETSKKSVKITLKEGTVYTLTLEALDKNDDVIAEVEKTIKVSDGKLMAKK